MNDPTVVTKLSTLSNPGTHGVVTNLCWGERRNGAWRAACRGGPVEGTQGPSPQPGATAGCRLSRVGVAFLDHTKAVEGQLQPGEGKCGCIFGELVLTSCSEWIKLKLEKKGHRQEITA